MAVGDKRLGPRPSATEAIPYHAPAQATAAIVTLADPASAKKAWAIDWIAWSYSATPTGGAWSMSDGTTTLGGFIERAGTGQLIFNPAITFPPDGAVTITIASGAGTVSGTCNVGAHLETIP